MSANNISKLKVKKRETETDRWKESEGDWRWDLGLDDNAESAKVFLELLMNASLLYCERGQTKCVCVRATVCVCVCVCFTCWCGGLNSGVCYSYSSFIEKRIPSCASVSVCMCVSTQMISPEGFRKRERDRQSREREWKRRRERKWGNEGPPPLWLHFAP